MYRETIDLQAPTYTPVRLINAVGEMLHALNDHRLALFLEVDSGQLSRIRHRKAPISDRLMIQIMDRTGWHITKVRELMGVPFDGPARLVFVAQTIGKRFPHLYSITSQDVSGIAAQQ